MAATAVSAGLDTNETAQENAPEMFDVKANVQASIWYAFRTIPEKNGTFVNAGMAMPGKIASGQCASTVSSRNFTAKSTPWSNRVH